MDGRFRADRDVVFLRFLNHHTLQAARGMELQ